jgi:translation initiation factor 1 (eIF-1/SUI1)
MLLVLALIQFPAFADSDIHPVEEGSHTTGIHDPWPFFHHDLQRTGLSEIRSEEPAVAGGLLMTFKTSGVVRSSPIMGDLTGDGRPEIIVGSFDTGVYCLGEMGHGTTGGHGSSPAPYESGFDVRWSYLTGDWVESTAAIADLGDNGEPEVLIGSYDGSIYCLNGKGDLIWTFATGDAITSSAAVADIDGDQELEIIIGSYDGRVYCLDEDGSQEWNYTTGGAVASSAAVAHLKGDQGTEILIGSFDGKVYCLDGMGELKWNYATGGAVTSSPAVADLDGDHRLEVIVGSYDGRVYCINQDGTLKWSFATGGAVTSSPAVADLDGDHRLEVIVGSYDGRVYCIDQDGTLKWSFATGGAVTSSPAVADLDEDPWLEVVVGSFDKNVYCIDQDGTLKWSFATGGAVTSSPAVADLDGDGSPDIVVGSDDNNLYLIELDRDLDGDGLLNSQEREIGTDIHAPDTDGDGVVDGDDRFPLDRDNDGVPDAKDFAPMLNNKIIYSLVVLALIISIGISYVIMRFLKDLKLIGLILAKIKSRGQVLIDILTSLPDEISFVMEVISEQPAKVKGLLLIGLLIAIQAFMGLSYVMYMTIQWDSDFCLLGCHVGNKLMAEPYYAWNESVHGNHVAECHDCHHARPTDNMLLMLEVAKGVTAIHKTAHVPDEKCTHCHVELEEVMSNYVRPLISPGMMKLDVDDFPLVEKPSETGHGVHVTREHIPCLECHTSGGVHRFRPKENICDKCHYDPALGPPEEYKVSSHGGGHGGGH